METKKYGKLYFEEPQVELCRSWKTVMCENATGIALYTDITHVCSCKGSRMGSE